MNEIITKGYLKKKYDSYAVNVLREYYKTLPKEKRKEHQKFEIVKELPTNEEYNLLKNKYYTTTVGDLVSDAISELESLRDELQDWYDNLPQQFQDGDKGSMLQDAISYLNSVQEIDIEENISKIELIYFSSLDCSSRAKRHAEAISMLQTASDKLNDQDNDDGSLIGEEATNTADEIDNLISEVESVEFPGMF